MLDFIRDLSGEGSGKLKGRVVPELGKEIGDKEIALLILEVVVMLVKCVANAQSKDGEDYSRVLRMVDEIQPWLGYSLVYLHFTIFNWITITSSILLGLSYKHCSSLNLFYD